MDKKNKSLTVRPTLLVLRRERLRSLDMQALEHVQGGESKTSSISNSISSHASSRDDSKLGSA